jgi:hypothetical protein
VIVVGKGSLGMEIWSHNHYEIIINLSIGSHSIFYTISGISQMQIFGLKLFKKGENPLGWTLHHYAS